MLELILVLLLLAGVVALVVRSSNANKAKELERKRTELEPVRNLVDEDVTALGTELQDLDLDMAGRELDPGANADYQRALDAYEAAKSAAARITEPEQVKNVTEILEDGRYAMACVRARVDGRALPIRRQPCFFDPRHGAVKTRTRWRLGGEEADIPACRPCARRVAKGRAPLALQDGGRPYFERDTFWARTGFGALDDDLAARVLAGEARR